MCEEIPVFIAYRRTGGAKFARIVRDQLRQADIPSENDQKRRLSVFCDLDNPGVFNFEEYNGAALRRSQSLVVIVTPGAAKKTGDEDWLYKEIDWWLENRPRVPPIVLNTCPEDKDRWIPQPIKSKWDLQWIPLFEDEARNDEEDVFKRVVNTILGLLPTWLVSEIERQRLQLKREKRLRALIVRLLLLAVVLLAVVVVTAIIAWNGWRSAEKNARLLGEESEKTRVALGEANVALARLFYEKADRAYEEKQLLDAEILFAKSLTLQDTQETRERLYELRLKGIRLAWKSPKSSGKLLALSDHGQGMYTVDSTAGTLTHVTRSGPAEILNVNRDDHRLSCFALDHACRFLISGDDHRTTHISTDKNNELQVSTEKGKVRLWNLKRPEESKVLGSGFDRVRSVAISPDGRLAAAGGWGGVVELYSTETGKVRHKFDDQDDGVGSLAFNSDATLLASGTKNKVVVWNTETGERVASITPNGDGYGNTTSLAFHPDGDRLAIAGIDGKVAYCRISLRKKIWSKRAHDKNLHCVAVFPDGFRIATASGADDNPAVRFLTAGERESPIQRESFFEGVTLFELPGSFYPVVFSDDGGRMAAKRCDDAICVWDLARREVGIALQHTSGVRDIAFHPDGKRLAAVTVHGAVFLWDLSEETRQLLWGPRRDSVWCIEFDPAGNRLAWGSEKEGIIIFDLIAQDKSQLPLGRDTSVRAIAFSADGRFLAAGGKNGLLVMDLLQGSRKWVDHANGDYVCGVAFGPTPYNLVVTSAKTGGLDFYERQMNADKAVWQYRGRSSREEEARDPGQFESSGLAISRESGFVAWRNGGGALRIWDPKRKSIVKTLLRSYDDDWGNHVVSFANQGTWIAATSGNGVRIWDVVTGEEVITIHGHERDAQAVLFGPNGQWLASGGADGTIRLYDLRRLRGFMEQTAESIYEQAEKDTGLAIDGVEVVVRS